MIVWLARRLFIMLITLFGITVLTFLLTRLTPGDPAAMRLVGSQGTALATGAYEDLLRLNRQNLGLDKPVLLNLEFASHEDRVRAAIEDAMRQSEFWQVEGERRLMLFGATAVAPLLDHHDRVTTDSLQAGSLAVGAQRARVLELLPRVSALQTTQTLAMSANEQIQWWHENAPQTESPVDAVARYMAAPEAGKEAALVAVRRSGSAAFDPLMEAMRRDDAAIAPAAAALEAMTSISYQDKEPGAVRARWESWWNRNRAAYVEPGPVESLTRVVTDTQFGVWMGQIVRLDFGESYVSRRPVARMIWEALPVSILLSAISIVLSYVLAIPIGVYSALRRHTPADKVITLVLFVLYSLPSFWVAGILILTTTGAPLNWFPTRGLHTSGLELAADYSNVGPWLADRVWHLVLPVLCLTYGSLAFISRQMRSAMLETISQDFVRTAVAKGLSPHRVVWKHILRNSLLPIITISAGILPELIAGAVIIESIFTIPGMGSLTFTAILNRDYPVINAVLLFSAFLTLLGILLADWAYSIADPRIEYR